MSLSIHQESTSSLELGPLPNSCYFSLPFFLLPFPLFIMLVFPFFTPPLLCCHISLQYNYGPPILLGCWWTFFELKWNSCINTCTFFTFLYNSQMVVISCITLNLVYSKSPSWSIAICLPCSLLIFLPYVNLSPNNTLPIERHLVLKVQGRENVFKPSIGLPTIVMVW